MNRPSQQQQIPPEIRAYEAGVEAGKQGKFDPPEGSIDLLANGTPRRLLDRLRLEDLKGKIEGIRSYVSQNGVLVDIGTSVDNILFRDSAGKGNTYNIEGVTGVYKGRKFEDPLIDRKTLAKAIARKQNGEEHDAGIVSLSSGFGLGVAIAYHADRGMDFLPTQYPCDTASYMALMAAKNLKRKEKSKTDIEIEEYFQKAGKSDFVNVLLQLQERDAIIYDAFLRIALTDEGMTESEVEDNAKLIADPKSWVEKRK